MKRYLFVLGQYYPKYSANGMCVQHLIDEILAKGDQATCVCIDDKYTGEKKDVEIHRVSKGFLYNAIYYSQFKKSKVRTILATVAKFLLRVGKLITIPIYPLCDPIYTHRVKKTINQLLKTKKYDYIIAVYQPASSIYVANKIKKKHPNMKYIAYFLDALSAGSHERFLPRGYVFRKNVRFENKYLANADTVINMQVTEEFYRNKKDLFKHYNQIRFLDIPSFLPREATIKDNAFLEMGKINFLYTGSLPIHIRNPRFFLEMFSGIKNDDYRLTIIGPNTCQSLLDNYCQKDYRIKVFSPMKYEEILDIVPTADFLINIGNRISNMTPSKIFEYMSEQKPIITTTAIDDEPSVKYLKKYPSVLVLNENNDLENAREEFQKFVEQNYKVQIDSNKLSQVFYLNTPAAFLNTIDEIS